MTFSHDASAIKEKEMQAFWRALRAARAIYKLQGVCPELDEYRDDIEVIQLCTDWLRLRRMCDDLLLRDDWYIDPSDTRSIDEQPADPEVLAG